MNTVNRNQVDEIIKEESHRNDTFAKVRIEQETGWVQLEE